MLVSNDMKDINSIKFIESVVILLSEIGKSRDISSLLFEMDINKSEGLLSDFITELGLTASPEEEEGVGCFSLTHLQKALVEIRDTGSTSLLDENKG